MTNFTDTKVKAFFVREKTLFYILFSIVLVASIHKMSSDGFLETVPKLHLRNVMSFWHFVAQQDLYEVYPEIYLEAHRYPPSFSLFMAPFAILPVKVTAVLFNLLSFFLLYLGFKMLTISDRSKSFLLLFTFFEMLTSVQNFQINTLQTGLMIITLCLFEKRRLFLAALVTIVLLNLKAYGAVIGIVFVFYPNKLKYLFYCLACFLLINVLVPLLMVDLHYLLSAYRGWFAILKGDLHNPKSFSVMSILNYMLSGEIRAIYVQSISVAILLAPLLRLKRFNEYQYRLLFAASCLVWVVIFNHKAESPTFIIAVSGVGLWYLVTRENRVSFMLMLFVFVFTTLSATSLFPGFLRRMLPDLYLLKTLPCVLVWAVLQRDLNSKKYLGAVKTGL